MRLRTGGDVDVVPSTPACDPRVPFRYESRMKSAWNKRVRLGVYRVWMDSREERTLCERQEDDENLEGLEEYCV